MVLMASNNGKKQKPAEGTDMDDKNGADLTDQELHVGNPNIDGYNWDRIILVGMGDDGVHSPSVEQNFGKLDARQHIVEIEGSRTGASSSNGIEAQKIFERKEAFTRPQVVIDVSKCPQAMEVESRRSRTANMIPRPGVIVAPASSSNIGNLSISDDFVEITVEKLADADGVTDRAGCGLPLQGCSTREEPVVILSMTAMESTSESLVTSTSESNQTLGILRYVERYNRVAQQTEPIYVNCSSSSSLTRNGNQMGNPENELVASGGFDEKLLELNANSSVLRGTEYLEVPEADDEDLSGGGDAKDDDSSGIILKDETDSADGEAESDQELTDSASETEGIEGNQRMAKPVIIISDQNYPRLVINFREEDRVPPESIPRNDSPPGNLQHFLEPTPPAVDDIGKGGNNNSIKDSTYPPIQNWVESVQRHNKRKRTASECVDEVP